MKEREIALFILIDIFNERAYNNIILRKTLNNHSELTSVQKAFVTELVNGTLRNLINIDYVIDIFSKTKTSKMKPFILNNLRIAVYQIIYMDKVPVSAACNEAVKLAKKRGFSSLSGFVNGVLRNVARNNGNITYPNNKTEEAAIKYSYPLWLVKYWLEEMDEGEVENMCIALSNSPKLSVCVNTLKTTKRELKKLLEKEGIEAEENTLLANSLYISRTNNISESQCYKEGLFHIMDESSMLAARVLSPQKGAIVVDVCAAPGGKSFALAEYMEDTGKIYSRDIYEHKVQLIREGAERLGIKSVETEVKDALDADESIKADYVLADVPCSGFGLVRKKPDIKYNRKYEDIESLAAIQRDILKASDKIVKKGGVIVYSTCTISHIENEDNVKWFCDNFGYSLEDISPYLPDGIGCDTYGYIKLLPHKTGTDGFFIARMRKNG